MSGTAGCITKLCIWVESMLTPENAARATTQYEALREADTDTSPAMPEEHSARIVRHASAMSEVDAQPVEHGSTTPEHDVHLVCNACATPTEDAGPSMPNVAASIRLELLKAMRASLSRIVDVFRQVDKNRSNHIDRAEFRKGLRTVLGTKYPRKVLDAVFDIFDADGSGTISYHELHAQLHISVKAAEHEVASTRSGVARSRESEDSLTA